jgi:uncharacterized membrane protein YuzA (DUF378 family)
VEDTRSALQVRFGRLNYALGAAGGLLMIVGALLGLGSAAANVVLALVGVSLLAVCGTGFARVGQRPHRWL